MTEDLGSMLAQVLAERYRIERELGQGGMATVYLARDLRTYDVWITENLDPAYLSR